MHLKRVPVSGELHRLIQRIVLWRRRPDPMQSVTPRDASKFTAFSYALTDPRAPHQLPVNSSFRANCRECRSTSSMTSVIRILFRSRFISLPSSVHYSQPTFSPHMSSPTLYTTSSSALGPIPPQHPLPSQSSIPKDVRTEPHC